MFRTHSGCIGRAFGPIIVLWFLALAAVGLRNISGHPDVLMALSPTWGLQFFIAHGWHGVFILGAVVLAVTGGETLYADMGHFGRRPIQTAWNMLVLPALTINYLGQGALLLSDAHAVDNPFYIGVPAWALYPMVGLATAATVIASQAVISGAYSATRQAIQLGYLPRMAIRHTSRETIGQVYIPAINWALMSCTKAWNSWTSPRRVAQSVNSIGNSWPSRCSTTSSIRWFGAVPSLADNRRSMPGNRAWRKRGGRMRPLMSCPTTASRGQPNMRSACRFHARIRLSASIAMIISPSSRPLPALTIAPGADRQ